ncbi:hypothetical protein [Caballeronia sp. NK8]|uniref:hypothetical protein n=1 Tax=Caballeronia sp. NK8 TaxID=140098 RepID=UPI001CED48E9|nr:hypothetical protein [Caballeronia sp. NK8]
MSQFPHAFSFECTTCGKCCNSPPALSLRELFRYRDVFIGAIAISRAPRMRAGQRVRIGPYETLLSDEDASACDALARLHTFPIGAHGDFISVTTQAIDYASPGRCPALADDGLCRLHADGKPDQCIAVPLDPLVPDRLQHVVLAQRSFGEGWLGAQCIEPGERRDPALVANGGIVANDAKAAMDRRRRALATEREWCGRTIVDALLCDFAADPRRALAQVPENGYRTISLVPALLVIGGMSPALAQHCIGYIDAQTGLIRRSITRAIERRRLDDRPMTQTLRAFLDALARAREHLASVPAQSNASSLAEQAETYFLGHGC